MANSFSSPFATSSSTSSLNSSSCSATAVFKATMADAQLASEPTALNSKRLPVNAKGEVLFLSVLSSSISGICGMSSLTSLLLSRRTKLSVVSM